MRMLILFELIAVLLFATPVAAAVREDFTGTWIAVDGHGTFAIAQSADKSVSVSDKKASHSVVLNGESAIPASFLNSLQKHRFRVRAAGPSRYQTKLDIGTDSSTATGTFEAVFLIGEGSNAARITFSGNATATVQKKKNEAGEDPCQGTSEPRVINVSLTGFSIKEAVPASVKTYLASIAVEALGQLNYTDTLIEADPDPKGTYAKLEKCGKPIRPVRRLKCSE